MGKKRIIGLIYSVNEHWIAGTYYIENLIHALNSLPQSDQPFLKIYCYDETDYRVLAGKTKYPNCQPVFIKNVTGLIPRILNRISFHLFKSYWVVGKTESNVDLIFPYPESYHFRRIRKKLFWIPDFQEKHYPHFFSTEQIRFRKINYDNLVQHRFPIVFSSDHAKRDFRELYPLAKNALFVMPFAVTLPDAKGIQISDLLRKYALPEDYFICPNQFWAHKNHQVVLLALKQLMVDEHPAVVVFTGKPFDNRNPEYYGGLLAQVQRDGIANHVNFLGFIPRNEQLILMKNSLAVIQPSLFEGWSTVVEDAKALKKNIIVSDIPVHREQLPNYELFFAPHDARALADHMNKLLNGKPSVLETNYPEQVRAFGRNFMTIVDKLLNED